MPAPLHTTGIATGLKPCGLSHYATSYNVYREIMLERTASSHAGALSIPRDHLKWAFVVVWVTVQCFTVIPAHLPEYNRAPGLRAHERLTYAGKPYSSKHASSVESGTPIMQLSD